MEQVFYACCELTRVFGNCFGWNYYETQTYLFLITIPAIYVVLAWITLILNAQAMIKYRPSIIPLSIFVSCAFVAAIYAVLSSACLLELFSTPDFDATQVCKDAMKYMREEVNGDFADYMIMNFIYFVYLPVVLVGTLIVCNIPHTVYRIAHRKKKTQ